MVQVHTQRVQSFELINLLLYYIYNALPAGMHPWTEEHASLQTTIHLDDERKWSSRHSRTLSPQVASPVFGFKSKFQRERKRGAGEGREECYLAMRHSILVLIFGRKLTKSFWVIFKAIIY